MALLFESLWQRQPRQTRLEVAARWRPRFRHFWEFSRGNQFTPDLVGDKHLYSVADASRFSMGRSAFGHGFRGDGSAASSAKGLFNPTTFPTNGSSHFSCFAFFTLLTSTATEAAIFRGTTNATGTGVALDLFSSTSTIRPLIQTGSTTGWTTANDVVDARMALGVPFYIGLSYIPNRSGVTNEFRIFGGSIGAIPTLIKVGTASGALNVAVNSMYVGGMEFAGGSTAAFPGVIHALGMNYGVDGDPVLTYQDIVDIGTDWQRLLVPRRNFFPPAAVVTFQAAWARNSNSIIGAGVAR